MRLEPLASGTRGGALAGIARPADVAVASVVQPQTRDEWAPFIEQALAAAEAGTEIPLVTLRGDEVVGSTRFLALRPEHRSVEIGWTWLHPSARGAPARTSRRSCCRCSMHSTRGVSPCRAQDRRVERALVRRSRSARRDLRGHPPQPHARARRREPRQRLVQRHRRGMAHCSRAPGSAPCREVGAEGTLRLPGIPNGNWSTRNDRDNPNRGRARARRLGGECAARGARPRPRLADAAARPPLRSRSCDRRGRGGDAARAVDRTRERRDSARRARAPRSALRSPSAAVVLQGSRPRAARRRLGRRDGRDG